MILLSRRCHKAFDLDSLESLADEREFITAFVEASGNFAVKVPRIGRGAAFSRLGGWDWTLNFIDRELFILDRQAFYLDLETFWFKCKAFWFKGEVLFLGR
ncbi:MAG: hypothetical protein KME18_22280 [Phormidium tanganyikae FI6-MK23]|nr:hypothetical protein [Phormidium tanganyikae FI6-MK23]